MSARNFYICILIVYFVSVSKCFSDFNDLPYAVDRIIVKFAPKADGKQKTTDERNAVLSALKAGSVKRSLDLVPGLTLVELPKDVNVPDALKLLKEDPNIICAEPDWILHLGSREPNDNDFGDQWGLHNTGQGFYEGGGYPSGGTAAVTKNKRAECSESTSALFIFVYRAAHFWQES